MAARQTAPVIGALCTSSSQSAQNYKWDVTVGYRFQESFRHYVGTVEQKERERLDNQIRNVYHLFDVAISYQVNPRWSVNASLPILHANRNQLYNPRGYQRVRGIGDMTIGAKMWIWRPPTEWNGNIQLGFSLKLPTGKSDYRTPSLNAQNQPVLAVNDQSVQAGDGATGFALDLSAYKRMPWGSNLYFSGIYLFNPADTNDVPTFRTRPGETVMSVSDQYLYRGGISHAMPTVKGLTVSFGGRIEGVPVRDAFGKSNGFRRPGYAISLDPGFMYSRNRYTFSMSIPWAIERNRKKSVADYRNNRHGDAAFADYTINMSLTTRF